MNTISKKKMQLETENENKKYLMTKQKPGPKNIKYEKLKTRKKISLLTTTTTPSYELSSLFEIDAITPKACPALSVTVS